MAVWFAQKAGNLSANDVFFDAPSGGNAKDISAQSDNTIILSANGFAIVIDEDVTALRLSTADEDAGGAGVAGGSFTVATGADRIINADVLAGSTPCLVCSHAATYRVTVNCQSTAGIKGGGTNPGYGMSSSSTGKITINALTSNANPALTGGTATACHGLHVSGAAAEIIINGAVLGGSAGSTCYGLNLAAAATATVNGNITGGGGAAANNGCNVSNNTANLTIADGYTITAGSAGAPCHGISNSATATVTVGQCILVNNANGSAIAGKCVYNPTNTNYIQYNKTSGTVKLTPEPAATDIKKDVVVGTVTGTYEGSGSGGGSGIIRSNLNRAGVIQ